VPRDPLDDDLQERIDAAALALAQRGGEAILASLCTPIALDYKGDAALLQDPVSSIDRAIEASARELLAERFPGHGVIGEECPDDRAPDADFVWVLDPIDGTSNFVHRYPLFACSIGVLHRGQPIAGAVWCSATPDCRTGVFHTRCGKLCLDGAPVAPLVRVGGPVRRLVGDVGPARRRGPPYDRRVSGSAAIECVLVAAGVLDAARFRRLWIWDVAGGVALVQAAGIPIWVGVGRAWRPFQGFEIPRATQSRRTPGLRDWHRPLLLGPLDASGHSL